MPTYIAASKNRLYERTVGEQVRGKEVLLGKVEFAELGWVVVRQEDVVDTDKHSLREIRENVQEKRGVTSEFMKTR